MADPTPPVVLTTPEEQRQNTTISLTLLQQGAQTRRQKITNGMIPDTIEPVPHNPNAVIPGTETGYRRNRFNPKTQDYTSGTGYQDNNETVGYSKQDLEGIQSALKDLNNPDNIKRLQGYGIDVEQLKTNGQFDPKKVQAMQQTVDVLVINYDTAVDLSDDQAKADVFIDAYDKNNPAAPIHHITGAVTFRDRKNMTPADIQKLVDASRQPVNAPVDPNNPNAALLVKRIDQRNELTTTAFPTQQDVDAQLVRFIDTLVVSTEEAGPLDDKKLKRFGQIFDPKTSPEELKKIADELKIPIETIEQWRKDPETMKLGEGFVLTLQDQHRRGNLTQLYPDGDEACNNTVSRSDLLNLKAGYMGTSPMDLPPNAGITDMAYRAKLAVTVSDSRIQLIKQGYVRPNLPANSPANTPYVPYQPSSASYGTGNYDSPQKFYQPLPAPGGAYPSSPYSSVYSPGFGVYDYSDYNVGSPKGMSYGGYVSPYGSYYGAGDYEPLSADFYNDKFNAPGLTTIGY